MDVILQNVIARPVKDNAGVEDLFNWECAIPGPAKVSGCIIIMQHYVANCKKYRLSSHLEMDSIVFVELSCS